jgi:predicted ester cyclase
VKHTINDVITEDDLVVVRWTATGTHTGEFQGVEPTGKQATWTGVGIFRFECGKIVEDWSEVDGVGRLQQLGAIATPTP